MSKTTKTLAASFRAWLDHRAEAERRLAAFDFDRPYEESVVEDNVIGDHFAAMGRIEEAILASPETGVEAARIKLAVAVQNASTGGEMADGWQMVAAALACLPPEATAAAA